MLTCVSFSKYLATPTTVICFEVIISALLECCDVVLRTVSSVGSHFEKDFTFFEAVLGVQHALTL